jgi:hypothetical protein
MPQLAFAGRQAATDFAQGLGLSELAKQHGDELPPTGETPRMALCSMPTHQRLKLQARKQLEQLGKNAAYSIHGGTSSVEICRFGKNHKSSTYRDSAFFQKPNLDKLGATPAPTFRS